MSTLVSACSEGEYDESTTPHAPIETEAALDSHHETNEQENPPTTTPEPEPHNEETATAPLVGPEAPPSEMPDLDDLLRLPESVTRPHTELAFPKAEPEDLTEAEREEARLRIEVQRQKESAEFDTDGSRTRERADAGLSVEVGGDTRVRGGVRVEKEADQEWNDPVPTVGIEGRF